MRRLGVRTRIRLDARRPRCVATPQWYAAEVVDRQRRHSIGWAAAIIGVLTIIRFAKGAGGPPYGIDASYYFQLARHVANGEGFVTTVSLYHEGWILPAKTTIYPLWPLLLGYVGRVVGLETAADLLPRLFYVANLFLLYLVVRAAAVRIGALQIGRHWWMPDTAHWLVAIFGLAPRYFGATTHPYTEGLAFFCAFASLLALERFDRTRGPWAAAIGGLFAGLAFLARTQMIGVAIGCFLALAWFAWRDRAARVGAVVWSIVALATVAPWFAFLGYVPYLTPLPLKRAVIPSPIEWAQQATALEWLRARFEALGVMFGPSNPYSYVQSFGVVAYLVPLAAIVAIAQRRWRAPQSIFRTAMLIAGLFFFFNLTLYQSATWMPWLFGWRHGLPYLFLIILAVPWLVSRAGRLAPAIAVVLLISVATNARAVVAFVRAPDVQLTAAETELVAWLDAQPRRVSVIVTNAQILGSMSDAHFYWTTCSASGETILGMRRELPIDYVVLYEAEARCRFAMEAGPMRVVKAFGSSPGTRVFVLRPLH